METGNAILIYAWIGMVTIMLPTAAFLFICSWLIAHIGNVILGNLKAIYRYECIKYYFEKMEKEGTHAFRSDPDKET